MQKVLSYGKQRELLAQTKEAYNAALDRLELYIRKRAFELTDSGAFSESKNPAIWELAENQHIPSVFMAVRDILWKGVLEIIFETNLDDPSETISSKTGHAILSFERRELLPILDEEFIRFAAEYDLALDAYTKAKFQQTSFLDSIPKQYPTEPEEWVQYLNAQK